ncbi:unnamed protein product [[Candida] boidinii]|nr:hypothetical protein BVG19_g1580 [[Candida] boidinii]OWB50327.1 hypothetical protein B5S27_g1876 [[Candida] boidinii]OWB84626.1 hypothetical protein B5S33_g3275 [[Candida] boidinii]GMF35960.1 unnamed protein product [[Candida] boidinii]
MSSWDQVEFSISPKTRGCYLITDEILQNVPQIRNYKIGTINLFLKHTSAALTLCENWDPDVRKDMGTALDRIVPEGDDLYIHSDEGLDDMPAHVKSSLIGASITIPIKNGKLATGVWQGVWLCEFRNYKHTRHIVATINGLQA